MDNLLKHFSADIHACLPNKDKQFQWERFNMLPYCTAITQTICTLATQLTHHTHLRGIIPLMRIASETMNNDPRWDKLPIVYARFNLRCKYIYIGKTHASDGFQSRLQTHMREVHHHYTNHKHDCTQKDSYDIQGKYSTDQWFMVPIIFADDDDSLGRLEKIAIKRYGTLNKRVAAKRHSRRFPHRRTRNRKRHRSCRHKQTLPLLPTIDHPVTTWHSTDNESTNLDHVMQKITTSNLPCHVTHHKGLISDTNFNSIFRKYSTHTVKLIDGRTLPLKGALCHIKRGCDFTVVAMPHRTSNKPVIDQLMYLAQHSHAHKTMRNRMADSDIEHCYKNLRLIRHRDTRSKATAAMRCIIKHRYKGFVFQPFILRMPYHHLVHKHKLRMMLQDYVRTHLRHFPTWLQDIHIRKARTIQLKNKSIGDHLINMRQHAIIGAHTAPQCMCHKLRTTHPHIDFPSVDGHIFITGEEYAGPSAHVLTQNCKNIPTPELGDVTQAIVHAFQKLADTRDIKTPPWDEHTTSCLASTCSVPAAPGSHDHQSNNTCSLAEVLKIKRNMNGLVVGPLDKNLGKLAICCPCLYDNCMKQTYDLTSNTHYKQVTVRPFHKNIMQESNASLLSNMLTNPPDVDGSVDGSGSTGNADDVISHFEAYYKRKGWDNVCPFNPRGKLGYMYAIFKDKNCTNPDVRSKKYKKARPITPYCKHPMKKLLHYAARAWMFILKQLKGSHFAIPTTRDFKKKLTDFETHFSQLTNPILDTKSWDISGCYTNMPKNIMLEAMKNILQLVKADPDINALHDDDTFANMNSPAITAKTSKEAVNIPKSGKGPIHWGYGDKDTRITLTFKQMLDIVGFSLDNAFFTLGNNIIQQVHGIPMGDPLSPAICIATCAYVEMTWFNSLPPETQKQVRFTRYLDDIYMVANKTGIPRYNELIKDFLSNCYPSCLELEETPNDEYLECKIHVEKHQLHLQHWNKNHEYIVATGQQYYLKQQHYHSYTTDHCKRGALIGTWTRMRDNCNTNVCLHTAIQQKRLELHTLGYPRKYVNKTLKYMHGKTKDTTWLQY